jgi:hypothetical protein
MNRLLEYDSSHRRVWIGGQRCHHGATGIIMATTAAAGLVAETVKTWSITNAVPAPGPSPRRLFAVVLAGGAMMAHDWKDRSIWFERGRGSQA